MLFIFFSSTVPGPPSKTANPFLTLQYGSSSFRVAVVFGILSMHKSSIFSVGFGCAPAAREAEMLQVIFLV